MSSFTLLLSSLVTTDARGPTALENRQSEQRQSWTSEPDCGSGTTGIIWQCLTTIFLCAYVSVHLNIPPVFLGKATGFLRRIFTVGTGILIPELWAWLAALDLVAARKFAKSTERLERSISLKQAFFICSGGMAIKGLHGCVPSLKPLDLHRRPVTAHSGTLYFHESIWKKDIDSISDQEIVFFAENVPSDDEIDDKSKQDSLSKLITLLQVLWTLVQIIARGQQGLAIPLIQVATLGYIAMAVSSYACWWHKPYDIETPYALEAETVLDNGKVQINPDLWLCAGTETRVNSFLKFVPRKCLPQVPQVTRFKTAWNHDTFTSTDKINAIYLGLLTMGFAAIHCIAWNYSFPTIAEAWIWRILMLVSIVFGIGILVLSTPVGQGFYNSDRTWLMTQRLVGPLAQIYLAGRLFMIVECIISFRDAPSSVYQQIDWSAYVPHFGA